MSSHSGSGGSAPPPTTTSGGGFKGKVMGIIMLLMFLVALIAIGIGVSFSSGAFKVIGIGIAVIIGLVVLVTIAGSGGGEGGHHGAGIFVVILAVVAVGGVGLFFMENIKRAQSGGGASPQQGSGAAVISSSGVVDMKVWAYPGTNYTSFRIGTGTNMWWVVDHESESIMYHFDRERPEQDQEDSKNGSMRVLPQMTREYTAHLRAKGLVPVAVTVYLTPIRP